MDVGLLNNFSNVFVFLLVFVGIFALLEKTKMLGDKKKSLNSMLALVVGIFVVISPKATSFIVFVLPWFFILGLVIMTFIFLGKMFGKSDKEVAWAFTWQTSSPVVTWIVIAVAVILLFGFSNMFGQDLLEDNPEYNGTTHEATHTYLTNSSQAVDTDDYGSNTLATLIHPKVLGMVVLLLVGLVSILLITKSGYL